MTVCLCFWHLEGITPAFTQKREVTLFYLVERFLQHYMVLCKPGKSSENPKIKLSAIFCLKLIIFMLAYPLKFEQELLKQMASKYQTLLKQFVIYLNINIYNVFYALSTFNQSNIQCYNFTFTHAVTYWGAFEEHVQIMI
jgi:hypothetical protein